MNEPSTLYRIFLLTIWQQPHALEPDQSHELFPANPGDCTKQGSGMWCFTLEDPRTGQRRSFRSVVALVAALQADYPGYRAEDL